jgi:hypothetical protein
MTSRFPRAGVHTPDMVSIRELSGRGHNTGRSGVVIAAPRAGMARLIAAPVAVGGWWARAPAPVCTSPEVVDSSMTITGSGISAATVSATEVAVQGTRRQGCYREFTR